MKLKGLTIAVTNIDAMVHFYNTIFQADLQPFDGFGTVLYRGELAGYELTFCPNALLGIEAEKNRQQLALYVDDLAATVQQVVACGGSQLQAISESAAGKVCGVTDPDGNSIELAEERALQV